MKSPSSSRAQQAMAIARKLGLEPIPTEGGYFKETFRSAQSLPNPKGLGGGRRPVVTVIYFMLFRDFNTMHRMGTNEVWTYHGGATLHLHSLKRDGTLTTHKLGDVLKAKENQPQVVIKRDTWMAAELEDPEDWVLISCTVAPGFEPQDSRFPNRDVMIAKFPQHRELFMRLIRVKGREKNARPDPGLQQKARVETLRDAADTDLAYQSPALR